jgi:hypothetical protein
MLLSAKTGPVGFTVWLKEHRYMLYFCCAQTFQIQVRVIRHLCAYRCNKYARTNSCTREVASTVTGTDESTVLFRQGTVEGTDTITGTVVTKNSL